MVSRTTNGSDTNIVARIMPGTEKMIWIPCSANHWPTQPSTRPYTSRSARPTTTGETAKGRSTIALSRARPRKRWRTMASAHRIPKTVLSGTATATITKVR